MTLEADSVRLRTIAAAVVNGDCPREEYLVERRRLLDLHAGEQTPDAPPAPAGDSDTRPQPALTEPAIPAAAADAADAAPADTSRRDLYVGVAALVGVLALLWGLLAWLW